MPRLPRTPTSGVDDPALRPLAVFAAIAVPTGWVFLTTYQVLDLPAEPFVLLTLLLGLVLPATLLMRGDPTSRALDTLRDCVRRPRPALALVPALVAIPGLTATVAAVGGVGERIDGDLVVGLGVQIASSVVIVNLWEELAWTGFFQRRAMSRWGLAGGSLVAAVLFAAIHLPLAFDDADSASTVLLNVAFLLASGVGLRLLVAGFDVWSHRSLLTVAVLHASFNAAAAVVDSDHDHVRYAVTVALGLAVLATPARNAYDHARSTPSHPDEELVR